MYSENQQALRAFKDTLAAVWGDLERTGVRGEEFFEEVEKAEQAYARVQELAPEARAVHDRVDEFLNRGEMPDRMTLVFLLADLDYEDHLREHLVEGRPSRTQNQLWKLTDEEAERQLEWDRLYDLRIALVDRLDPAYDVSYYWPPGSEPPGV